MSHFVLSTCPRCKPLPSVRFRCMAATTSMPPATSTQNEKKLAVITGANTGIGFETAKALGKKGYDVVLACRDETKGKNAMIRLKEDNPSASFELRQLTLDDLSNVKDFVKRTLDKGRTIDVLLNNAGVMACPEMKTKDGYEYQLGVNHLSHFTLTTGLLPLMTNPERESRVVTVSSSAHLFGTINFDDVNLRKNYTPWGAYGQSKFANVLFAFELAKRLPYAANCTSNTLHPGVVNTELARYLTPKNSGSLISDITMKVTAFFLKTPEEGAQTSIYLASSPEVAGVSCKYFADCQPKVAKYDTYDANLRQRFWDLSREMTGVDADIEAAVKSPIMV